MYETVNVNTQDVIAGEKNKISQKAWYGQADVDP